MPIYKELSNLHLLQQWRNSTKSGGAQTLNFDKLKSRLTGSSAGTTEAYTIENESDYIKRICEHFKAFQVKLETYLND